MILYPKRPFPEDFHVPVSFFLFFYLMAFWKKQTRITADEVTIRE